MEDGQDADAGTEVFGSAAIVSMVPAEALNSRSHDCALLAFARAPAEWALEVRALGHEARLMPAQYVKAYVKRNKNDPANAEASRFCPSSCPPRNASSSEPARPSSCPR